MFDELRKRISGAIKGFIKKEEEKPAGGAAAGAGPEAKRGGERGVDINLSAGTKIKGAFLGEIKLSQKDIDNFIEDLEPQLLQSDVSYKAAEALLARLREMLKNANFKSKTMKEDMLEYVRRALFELLGESKEGVDLIGFIKTRISSGNVPVKILFIGPNGTGKTTTMGKIASMLKQDGIDSVFSASDTFRAAAIEQTEHHAKAIGVPVIKSSYGADPPSIAFDAIAYSKAHNIPVVLIDTAGRQETNKNLVNEMLKMVRVAKPDMTIFVGESTSGNALANQITEFSAHMKIDGIILTKLDCDAKGGNAISIAYTAGIPILFFGTGEAYGSLKRYSDDFVVNSILPK